MYDRDDFDFGLPIQDDEAYHEDMVKFRAFINKHKTRNQKKLFYQDTVMYFMYNYGIRNWTKMYEFQEQIMQDVLEARDYFEEMEWYEELAYIKDGIQWAQEKLKQNENRGFNII